MSLEAMIGAISTIVIAGVIAIVAFRVSRQHLRYTIATSAEFTTDTQLSEDLRDLIQTVTIAGSCAMVGVCLIAIVLEHFTIPQIAIVTGIVFFLDVGLAGLTRALEQVQELREEFWRDVRVTGTDDRLNQELEKAGRVADFLELAELMITDALDRQESCGAHFREEYALPDGEAKRDDERWCNVSAWETNPAGQHRRYQEPLRFESVKLQVRNYR